MDICTHTHTHACIRHFMDIFQAVADPGLAKWGGEGVPAINVFDTDI